MCRWVSLALAAAVIAGCVQSGASEPGASSDLATGPAVTDDVTSAGGPSPSILTEVSFAGAPLRLPDGWRAMYYSDVSSFFQLVAFLGPDLVPDPCTRWENLQQGTGGSQCSGWPAYTLQPGAMFAAVWRRGGPPGVVLDMGSGDPIVVAGRAGRLRAVTPDEGCQAMGGDEQITVIVPSDAVWNWDQLDACLRGPDHATNEAIIRRMVTELPFPSSTPAASMDPTYPNDNGVVAGPGRLRLRSIELTFPPDWHSGRDSYAPAQDILLTYLSPDLLKPCANWATCDTWPPVALAPGGLITSVWLRNREDWTLDSSPGVRTTVAGRAAAVATGPADTGCAAIGGDERITAVIPHDFPSNFYAIDACLRGPDHAANEAIIRQMLASAVRLPTWTPEPPPTPVPGGT